MKKTNKWLGVAAISLAIATSLSACGSGSGDTGAGDKPAKEAASQTGPFKLGSEPVNFTMYPNYDWLTLDPWGQDPQTQWITDNLKVTVTPIQSGGAAKQKFSTMLATDDLPDVILMDRGSDVEKLRQAGKLVALDDYYNKYPNLKKWMGEETINMLRSPDGKIYQVPNWYTTSANGNGGYLINRKVYKELGSPKLETFDDLYNYLKQVKAKYPDMIPFETDIEGQGVQIMTSGFKEGFAPSWVGERGVPSGDKFTSLFTDPVFNETMKFASKLFREKLITQDTLTQKREQVDEKLANGRVAIYAAYSVLEPKVMDANTLMRAKDPDSGYEVIWPFHKDGIDKTKVYPNSYNRLGWNVNVITTTSKNPEGIFAYMDWLTSPEGMSTMYFGPKGKYWSEMDSNQYPVLTDKWFSTSQEVKDKEKLGGYAYVGNTTYLDTMKMANDKKMKPEQRRWDNTQQANVTWKTSQDLTQFINLDPASDSEEGIAKTAVDDIYKKYFAQALFAQSDAEVDMILKKANDEAMSQGYQKLLDYKTAQWKKNLEQMQVK